MNRFPLPVAAEILPMPDLASRFQHVCRHLYVPSERWDLVVEGLPDPPNLAARIAGCPGWLLKQKRPDYWGACSECQAQVANDHDQFLRPAYETALASAIESDRWTNWSGERGGEAFVGDNGVLVIVNRIGQDRRRQVATAYRVRPRGVSAQQAGAQDFFDAAVRKLRDRTSLIDGGTHE